MSDFSILNKLELYQHVAPFVIGSEMAREFAGLQMFCSPFNEQFHILFVGDPGSVKSTIADYSIKVWGKEHSAKVTKNTSPGGLTGVDASGGIRGGVLRTLDELGEEISRLVFVDELDKWPQITKKSLLESMVEKTVTNTKRGRAPQVDPSIVNIISTCNPKGMRWRGKFDMSKVGIDDDILSRFHIILPFRDTPASLYGDIGESFFVRETPECRQIRLDFTDMVRRGLGLEIKLDKPQSRKAGDFCGELKDRAAGAVFDQITPRLIIGFQSLLVARAKFKSVQEDDRKRGIIDEDFNYIYMLFRELQNWWLGA